MAASLAVTAALFLSAANARAAWPKPAAGASASGHPEVIFTFDDGPDQRFTPKILSILRQWGVQGIFFWVGGRLDERRSDYPRRRAAALRAVRDGHLVGTHTVSHVHLCRLSPEESLGEIEAARREYAELTGLPMILFRAPYGDHCPKLVELLREQGLSHVHWDVDPHEWKDHDSDRVADSIIADLRHLDGRAIVLMHDTTMVTVKALDRVLRWIDAENQRRRQRGRKTIRIIDASDWLAETLDPAVVGFAGALVGTTLERVRGAGTRLLPGYPTRVVSR